MLCPDSLIRWRWVREERLQFVLRDFRPRQARAGDLKETFIDVELPIFVLPMKVMCHWNMYPTDADSLSLDYLAHYSLRTCFRFSLQSVKLRAH